MKPNQQNQILIRAVSVGSVKLLFAILAVLISALGGLRAQSLPDLITFNFSMTESNTLPGTSAAPGAQCNGTIAAADQIGRLALVGLFYQVDCFTDGRYNNNNYPVAHGTVTGSGGGGSFDAYQVFPALNTASNFLASQHGIYYRFPVITNYTVYTLVAGTLTKLVDVPAANITTTNDFTPVVATNVVSVDGASSSVIYVFAPSSVRMSSYTVLAPGVEGARIASTPFGDVLKYRYSVPGSVFDTVKHFPYGPANFQNAKSDTRHYFLVKNGASGLGVVWQDQATTSIYLTWFGANRLATNTVSLANPSGQRLDCAAGDGNGNVFYLTVQTGSTAPTTPIPATLTKAGPTGNTIVTKTLDTSSSGLNMVSVFDVPSVASMTYLNGQLGVIIGRTMLQSGDGLNHQGAIAVVFDATTLNLVRNWGQTSGHSWDSVLTTNFSGKFLGLDLGDNFPRGVHLHRFDTNNIDDCIVSTFKTQHGTTAQSPSGATYPVYSAISTGGTTYYEWSNDNSTYTEIGGPVQTALGYIVGFVGERSPNGGGLLDNSRIGNTLNDPRNVGIVGVREDFQNSTASGTVVSDDLVRTTGTVETNGYYSFTGGWTPQRNAGIVWLTSYGSLNQNASRLRVTPRTDGSVLLLWELWSTNGYVTTKGLTLATNATVINSETDLGTLLRLGRREEPWSQSDGIYLPAGSSTDGMIELNVIQSASAVAATAPTLSATLDGSNVNISWNSVSGNSYQLQSATNLAAPVWSNVGATVAGNGALRSVAVPKTSTNTFFRVSVTAP